MTELMLHAVSGDSYYPAWPQSKASQRKLPLPLPLPSSCEPYPSSRVAPSCSNAPPTPPPTNNMNAGPVLPPPSHRHELPSYRAHEPPSHRSQELPSHRGTEPPSNRSQELSYPVRSQPNLSGLHGHSLEASSSRTHVKTQPSLATLAQAEPEERHSPSSNSPSSPAFELPTTISAPQPDLPQLAAEVACLFWYEDASTIARIEQHTPGSPVPANAIASAALASTSFRKWVTQLLATTKVTQNVIILALLFIYKLRSFKPEVKGGPNSEFKLMTVALMLGNKFLDDNTYTNKTWAEVSGMPVQDIHVMEVEFLSNMRYSLFISEHQWNMWHLKLGKIGTYIHAVAQARAAAARAAVLTPVTAHASAQLPASPNSFQHLSPILTGNYSPHYEQKSHTPIMLPQPGSSAVSHGMEMGSTGKKRSYDEGLQEPPTKRLATSNYQTQHQHYGPPANLPPQVSASYLTNLPPLPSSHLPTAHLPAPGPRPMTLVYTPPVQLQPQVSQATNLPSLHTAGLSNALYSDRQRQMSPFHSATVSPVHPVYTPTAQTASRLSPSYFLQQRSSPYRPVMQVQTLLAPPPSTPSYHAPRMVAHDHLQYHPLGRPMNERRVGHLPYLEHEAWPRSHQLNQWADTMPVPQPNFYA